MPPTQSPSVVLILSETGRENECTKMIDVEPTIEDRLLRWYRDRLGPAMPLEAETDLLEAGYLDSLLLMELVASLNRQYGVTVDYAEITPRNFRSVRTLAALLRARCGGPASSRSQNRSC
jgi:acyl carrier protein